VRLAAALGDLFSRTDDASGADAISVRGRLSYRDPQTERDVDVGAVAVSVRGNTSRRDSECTFPKLKIEFSKSDHRRGTLFDGVHAIKIGTHCGERSDGALTKYGRWANDKSPHREAFVYALLNAIGIPTLDARPADITYVDDAGGSPPLTRRAMLLEDDDAAIARLGGKGQLDRFDSAREDFDTESAAGVAFAEAMIGNFDWAVKFAPDDYYRIDQVHPLWNVLAIDRHDGKAFPLIYDFDLSGIVAGSHPWFAKVYNEDFLPSKSHPAIEVLGQLQRTRLLFDRADLDRARARFAAARPTAYRTLEQAPIDPQGRTFARAYLDAFFQFVGDDAAFYRPTVSRGDTLPYLAADGDAPACGADDRIPAGTAVSDPLERRNGRVRVVLLDTTWHWASRCDAVHRQAVWVEETAIAKR